MKKAEELIETRELFRKRLYDDIRDDFYDERKSKQIGWVILLTFGGFAISMMTKDYIK